LNLDHLSGAKILIFIGRWVKQKGVDHIAMLTPVFLRSHPEVQIVLAGGNPSWKLSVPWAVMEGATFGD
jgi:glycosyltransferase involved in cell wall biosynthesis